MSWLDPRTDETTALTVDCPACWALPGHWCRAYTKTRNVSPYLDHLHPGRFKTAYKQEKEAA